MISKELQRLVIAWAARNKEKELPFSRGKYGTIVLKDHTSIAKFEQAYPHFVKYRHGDIRDTRYIDSMTENLWKVVSANKYACHGRRFYRAIVDSSINEDVFREIVWAPMTVGYCDEVEFFN